MEITKIAASSRSLTGKGPAAKLRRTGQIPAIAYGKGKEAQKLAVSPKELLLALKSAHGKNSVIELDAGGEKLTVLVRDYTYHPVTRALTHVDFIHISLDQPVDVEVPLTTSGKAVGITNGGVLRVVYRTLPIRCLPEKIPVKIDHDITALGLNESVKASALKMPEGVKVRLPDDQTVVTIVAPEKEREEAAAVPGAAAAAPAAGAAAAPAAGAKKDEKAAAPAKDAKKKLRCSPGATGGRANDFADGASA